MSIAHFSVRCITTTAALAAAAIASAQITPTTVAYWRFEQIGEDPATAGAKLMSPIPGGNSPENTVMPDSSGNGNELRTFHSPNVPEDPDFATRLDTSPEFVATVPHPTVPATGQPNLLSLDFDSLPALDTPAPAGTPPNDAGADDIYSLDGQGIGGPLNNYNFTQFTIEASFKIDALDRFQVILGKDDNPDAAPGPLSPFAIKILNNNVLEVYAFDGTGAFRNVLSDRSNPGAAELKMATDRWYNMAVTNDGTTMRLYLDDTSDSVGNYVLLDANSEIMGGALVASNDIWTVGRGWFNDGPAEPGPDGVADFFDGQIDEVRITDGVLNPSDFLFAISPPVIDADFDNDNDVDGNDFLIWQRGFGAVGNNSTGDADGSGTVDAADLAAWRQRFGQPVGAAPIPEPSAAVLVVVGAGLAGLGLRRR